MFHPLEIRCMSETQIYQDCDIVSNLCNISVILGFWIFFFGSCSGKSGWNSAKGYGKVCL